MIDLFRPPRRLLVASLLVLIALATAAPAQDIDELEERAFKEAVAKVAPSVVYIRTVGGLDRVGKTLIGSGPTTGLVVAEDGYVISSAFNFVQKPSSILVTLPSGKRASAEIVARDQSRMLVLLKVNTDERLVAPIAVRREEMIVGQWSLAVGRTFDAERPNMSVGVLSATNRIWGKAIQSDAKISPSNYGGPLIDIHGNVLGVLVPMSPQGKGEMAGSEWYDSGIGFAVPLDDVFRHLDTMKAGEDLFPGLLGVSLKGSDVYADAAILAGIHPKSPAAEGGLKVGDKIVEVDGVPIIRQAQLKHALGKRYAGDQVKLVVARGEDRINSSVKLVDKLVPYEHPFLGILPARDNAEKGVAVRYVYPGSPADEAGIASGDRLVALAGIDLQDANAMRDLMGAYEPGVQVAVKIVRGAETLAKEVTLVGIPSEIPAEVPAAKTPATEKPEQPPVVGEVEIKIPEEPANCLAYVPENYHPDVPHGLLVWLHAPGKFNKEELIARWKSHCEQRGLILLAPQSADPKRWRATDADFIRKTIDDVLANYNVDRSRIVTHGHQAGGAMAFLVAFKQRDLIRGVASVDSALPQRTPVPNNDPVQRLAIYMTTASKSRLASAIEAGSKRLVEMKFPVTLKDQGEQARYLSADEISELVRWIDTLDRI